MFKQLVSLIFIWKTLIFGPLLTTKTACREANLPKPDPVQVYDAAQTVRDGQV